MEKISFDTVAKYWREVNAQSEEEVFRCLKQLYAQQPLIMSYLMRVDQESLNKGEHQMMYFLGSFITQVMLRESPAIAEITKERMEKVHDLNLGMLGYLGSELPENFRSSMDNIIDSHNQADLFRFVVEILMKDPEIQRSVREENVWRLFTHLKIVIDCLQGQSSEDTRHPSTIKDGKMR